MLRWVLVFLLFEFTTWLRNFLCNVTARKVSSWMPLRSRGEGGWVFAIMVESRFPVSLIYIRVFSIFHIYVYPLISWYFLQIEIALFSMKLSRRQQQFAARMIDNPEFFWRIKFRKWKILFLYHLSEFISSRISVYFILNALSYLSTFFGNS